MSWIEFVFVLVIVAVLGTFVLRRSRALRSVKQLAFAAAKIQCRAPRYREGVARMLPAVVREVNEHLRCTLWKHHDGDHEAPTKDGVERWSPDEP